VPKNRPNKNRSASRADGRKNEEQRIEMVFRSLEQKYERVREQREVKGVRIAVFRSKQTPFGSATAVVRMSKADIKNGETVMTQLNPELVYADRAGLAVGHIVAVTECSGGNAYWQRPDLNEVEALIAKGICRDVIWLDVTRMARERRTFLDHADLLEQHDIGLHIEASQRQINLHDFGDRMTLAIQVEFAVFERLLTRERTQRGIWEQKILTGKGNFPQMPYGFDFDDDGWLRPYDPEWRWVKAMHYGLIEFRREDGSGYPRLVELFRDAGSSITVQEIEDFLGSSRRDRLGLRAFADVITMAGENVSAQRLSDILNDPIYVDGVPVNTVGGIPVAMKPVHLEDPIPTEAFARNQQIFEVASASSIKVKLASFAFTGILKCGVCDDDLMPYFGGIEERAGYRHRGKVPEGCRGIVFWRDEIEPPIIRELHRLDWDEDRRYRYFELAQALDTDKEYWEQKAIEKIALQTRYEQAVAASQPIVNEQVEVSLRLYKNEGDPLDNMRALDDFHSQPHVKATFRDLDLLRRQLQVFESIAEQQRRSRPRLEVFDQTLADLLPSIMTEQVPHELEARLDRRRALKACLSEAKAHPTTLDDGTTGWEITLQGPLGPRDARASQPIAPSSAAKNVLKKVIRTVNQS
jgi:DNA invertase Pin-like site-specific DNA recombinase